MSPESTYRCPTAIGDFSVLTLSQSNFIEALAAWGAHEAMGRMKAEVQLNVNDKFACADFALRYRAPLVARICDLEPQATVRVEFEPAESDAFLLFDRRKIDELIQTFQNDSEAKYLRTMVEAANPPEGPLVTSALCRPSPPIGPIILWDGWHRAAAWRERYLKGRPSRITAFLILTAK